MGEVWESVGGVNAVVFEVRSGEWTGWVSFGCGSSFVERSGGWTGWVSFCCVSSSGRIVRVKMGLGEFW